MTESFTMLQFYAYLGIGSALGAVARVAVLRAWPRSLSANQTFNFPLSTFAINMLAVLLLGFVAPWNSASGHHVTLLRLLYVGLGFGFIATFSTMVTFCYEITSMLRARDYMNAVTYVLVTLGAGMLAAGIGVRMGLAFVDKL